VAVAGSASGKKKIVRKPVEVEVVEEVVTEEEEVVVSEVTAYIPDEEIGDSYISRKINGGVWDIALFEWAQHQAVNILLSGDTGSGKTAVGRAYASKKGCLYYGVPCDVSIDPTAMIGKMMPLSDGKFGWVDGPITSIVRGPCGLASECEDDECYAGVLNISEVNFMSPKIAASLYSLLDSRRQLVLLGNEGEVITAHHNLLIVADMNPNYRGTQALNDAFKNRFGIQINWGYSDDVEKKLIKSASLLAATKSLRNAYGKELRTPVGTNALMEFEQFALEPILGVSFAIHNFVNRFQPDEQGAVRNILSVQEKNLMDDYATLLVAQAKSEMDGVEEEETEEYEDFGDEEFEYEIDDE
jgi:hypothetical protein